MKKKILGIMLVLGVLLGGIVPASAKYIMVGLDEKISWNADGSVGFLPPGKDVIEIFDVSQGGPEPKVVALLELENSLFGPPTNLAITNDNTLALAANSMNWVEKDGAWEPTPGRDIYVIDLEANPPRRIATVQGDLQPSGMAINKAGTLALVANRKGNSVSVFSIEGKKVTFKENIPMGTEVAAVAITPDGTKAWVVKSKAHALSLLNIDGDKVTPADMDVPVLWPFNVETTPDGVLAFCADMGGPGGSSGHVDTVSVIDMTLDPPRVIDRVVVGDGPEGFAVSPTGEYLATVNMRGSEAPQDAWFYNRNGSVSLVKIEGKKLTKINEVEIGALPEAIAWSPDGKWIYVGNFLDKNISVLKVEEGKLVNTGKTIPLKGAPASMRGPVN